MNIEAQAVYNYVSYVITFEYNGTEAGLYKDAIDKMITEIIAQTNAPLNRVRLEVFRTFSYKKL